MSDFWRMVTNSLQPKHPKEVGQAFAKKRKALKLTQEKAALTSGISLSMLRRAESHGRIPLPHLLRLAETIGYQVHFQEKPLSLRSNQTSLDLNKRYPGLVWSNSKAPKEIFIRKALLNPRFTQLLQLAQDFSLATIQKEWTILCTQSPSESQRVAVEVTRILRNMERGFTPGKR
jgi:transcriptional regulator with XRE-family HTH domain